MSGEPEAGGEHDVQMDGMLSYDYLCYQKFRSLLSPNYVFCEVGLVIVLYCNNIPSKLLKRILFFTLKIKLPKTDVFPCYIHFYEKIADNFLLYLLINH